MTLDSVQSLISGTSIDAVESLSPRERDALAALLLAAAKLHTLAHQLTRMPAEVLAGVLHGGSDAIEKEACRLAGILESEPHPDVERLLIAVELERHTEAAQGGGALWSSHVRAFDDELEASHLDAPSRDVAFALGLVGLAQLLLDRAPAGEDPHRQARENLAGALGDAIAAYDDELSPIESASRLKPLGLTEDRTEAQLKADGDWDGESGD